MYLRYSFIVVAPTTCNSPRDSAGLMMLLASIAPSAEPAPTMVCKLVDEQDDVLRALDLVHHGLDALLELAAILRARHHQREVEGHDALVAQNLRNVALGNFLGQAFHDGGLADTGFAEQHRVVLGAAAQNLDHALDFVLAAHHRVEFALAGQFRQVAPEHPQRGRLHFLLAGGGFAFFGSRLHSG